MKREMLQHFLIYDHERFTKKIIFKEEKTTIFTLNFQPGQQLPPHKHPGHHVYLLMLQGEGTFIIDGTPSAVKQHDLIFCTSEEELSFHNDSQEPASLYVMLTKI